MKNLNEKVCLVNVNTQESRVYLIQGVNDFTQAFEEMKADVHSIELQYLGGCLTGEAANAFLEVWDLAESYGVSLEQVGKIYNACDCAEDVSEILELGGWEFLWAKTPALACRSYLEDKATFAGIPISILDYMDFQRVLYDSPINIYQTHAPRNYQDQVEYLILNAA